MRLKSKGVLHFAEPLPFITVEIQVVDITYSVFVRHIDIIKWNLKQCVTPDLQSETWLFLKTVTSL